MAIRQNAKSLTSAERILIGFGITSPAEIDLEAIAWDMGAIVKYHSLEHCEGRIIGNDRRAVISINKDSIPTRQRFSLGHEIGHWHHHRGRLLMCGSKEIENPANDRLNRDLKTSSTIDPEREADEFASDIIFPNYLFRPRAEKMKHVTLEAARQLSSEFTASLTATLIKIAKTDFPIMLVCHNKRGRHWFIRPDMVSSYWWPKKELDKDSFAFDILFNHAPEDTAPRLIGADAWFDVHGASDYEVYEQSFVLPNAEILTVLRIPDEGLV